MLTIGLKLDSGKFALAHLKRDFTQIAERSGLSSELGNALLEQQQLLFEHWYRVRDGTLSRTQFITIVAPIRQQVQALLRQAAEYDISEQEKTTRRENCANLSATAQARACSMDVCYNRWR